MEGDYFKNMIEDRNSIIQNLKDAGCNKDFIADFLHYYDQAERGRQIALLTNWRNCLLEQIHEEERKISCLDYLIYRLQNEYGN